MTEKERILLAGCLKAEKAAWDAFVLQYSALIYHTIKRTFILYHTEPLSDLIEDLYQEFFVSLLRDDFKKLRQFKGDRGCTLASWIRVVAARLAIDFLRKQQPSTTEIKDTIPNGRSDPVDSLIDEERERALSIILESLPARDRIFIDLYFRQGLSPEETAAILKTSVNAVYTQKSRLQDKFREILKKTPPQ